MASRSLGELLVLRPTAFTRPLQTSCPHSTRRIAAPSYTTRRRISHTPRALSEPQRKKDDDNNPFTAQPDERRTSQSQTSRTIDSLFAGLPKTRPPPFTKPTSAEQVHHARVFGSQFASESRIRPSRRPRGLDFGDMALPESMLNPTLENKPSEAANLAVQQEETFSNYPHLNPTYGRSVNLDPSRGRDIVRGIGMLGSLVARNKIKNDFNKQKFHERGGLKRKRLNSERWRARFKLGFRAVTTRVTELTRKGW